MDNHEALLVSGKHKNFTTRLCIFFLWMAFLLALSFLPSVAATVCAVAFVYAMYYSSILKPIQPNDGFLLQLARIDVSSGFFIFGNLSTNAWDPPVWVLSRNQHWRRASNLAPTWYQFFIHRIHLTDYDYIITIVDFFVAVFLGCLHLRLWLMKKAVALSMRWFVVIVATKILSNHNNKDNKIC